ncbi:hypothetical protein BC936DRAFT_146373 [Jimgerdemannia flammicorona]|uniref:Uncharacterized protein n=1 Tax=Jimgerdemannia flammicorona TaxID=994334 RepID=A0A433D7S4_9FUNG|nr:hypothetical protein BC936DRAFT_146373 [Jimgerdemannia flammicorona]
MRASMPPASACSLTNISKRKYISQDRKRNINDTNLIDDGHGQQDTSSGPDRAKHISQYGQGTDASTTERGCGGDDALELLVHGGIAVAGDDHLLVLELLGHVAGGGARDLDPGLGE